MSYTKGPWKAYVTRGGGWAVCDNKGKRIVGFSKRLGGHGVTYWFQEDEASARLIAQSPAMYEAAKDVIDTASSVGCTDDLVVISMEALKHLKQVVSQAEGIDHATL